MPDEPEQQSPEQIVRDTEALGGMSPAAVRLEEVHQRLRDEAHDPNAPGAPRKEAPAETPPAPEDAPAKGSPEYAWASMNRQLAESKSQIDKLIQDNEALESAREELRQGGAMVPAQPGAYGQPAGDPMAAAVNDLVERMNTGTVEPSQIMGLLTLVQQQQQSQGQQMHRAITVLQQERAKLSSEFTSPRQQQTFDSLIDGALQNYPQSVANDPKGWANAAKILTRDHHAADVTYQGPGVEVGRFNPERHSEGAAPGSFEEPAPELSEEGLRMAKQQGITNPKILEAAAANKAARESRYGRPKRSGGGF